MLNQRIEKLLILQDRDQALRRITDQLTAIPRDLSAHESEIEDEKRALANAKANLQALEMKRKDLEIQVGSAEDQISKYRIQQLQVKKNEEYQALTHEIALTDKKIQDWEEQEIALMLDIDSESEAYDRRRDVFEAAVSKIESQMVQLKTKQDELQGQLNEAEAHFSEARDPLDAQSLAVYERLASRIKLPVIVPVHHQKCEGCHLRVSNEILEQSGKGEELTTCDNCGRVVYLAS